MKTRVAIPLAVFAYLLAIRTYGISRTFWLFGDQTLYWDMALGPWRDLPLGGGPSQVGGTTLGPVFVWSMWVFRCLIGPVTDNLPHAGGIGLCIVQSAADVLLMTAIWKRWSSLPLALAATIFAASAPYDMALTATIWNPPLAVAFAKTAVACVLLGERGRSLWWSVGATAAAILCVQSHSSGLFIAAPVAAAFTLRAAIDGEWEKATRVAIVTATVVLVLEAPYLVDRIWHPDKITRPVAVADSVAATIAQPSRLRPAASFTALASAEAFILGRPWTFPYMPVLLGVMAIVVSVRARSDVTLLCITVFPLVAAVAGFSLWQGAYDHYWYLVFVPSVVVMAAMTASAIRPLTPVAGIVLAAAVALTQPSRITDAMTFHRLPEYEALSRGSQAVRRRTPAVRSIRLDFDLPRGVDGVYLYKVLGGRIDSHAGFDAVIHATGDVEFTMVGKGD